jgi:Fic family protein
MTEAAMADLLDWYNETLPRHPWPPAVASELVFRFLACHPFQDGNGRIGRALFILALLQSSDEHLSFLAPYLAVDRFIEQHKGEYYTVLARAGSTYRDDPTTYDITAFLRFMLKVIDLALDAIPFYKERIEGIRALSEAALATLRCFKEHPEQRLTPRAIRQQTGLPERTVSRALRSLTRLGLLQRYGRGAATRYQLVF